MTTLQEVIYKTIVGAYTSTQYVTYLGVSGFALVIADFVHTFPDEVRLMWPTPISVPKVFFFALRYHILVHGVFVLTCEFNATPIFSKRCSHRQAFTDTLPTNPSAAQCQTAFNRVAISTKLTVIASETILLIRVYAFSGKDKKILAFLLFQFIGLHVSELVVFARWLESVKLRNIGCIPASGNMVLLGIVFGLLLCSVTVIMLAMLYIMFRKYRDLKTSSLVAIIYRDGLVYFLCLSALACANVGVILGTKEAPLKLLLVQPEAFIHAILSTRMLLHLRSWSERQAASGDASALGGQDTSTGVFGHNSYANEHNKILSQPGVPLKLISRHDQVQNLHHYSRSW
ncbi:hypothetical protein MD484_g7542, partial [Candolleomyces efflorescens]